MHDLAGVTVRPEDHLDLAHQVARRLVGRLPGAEYDDLVADGMEALVRACAAWAGQAASFRGFARNRVRCDVIDAHRLRVGRYFTRPLPTLVGDDHQWTAMSPSAEAEALDSVVIEELLDRLSARQQRIALASMVPGGQRRLARELGLTEGALSHQRRKIRAALAPYREECA